jgi:hypothetical protein
MNPKILNFLNQKDNISDHEKYDRALILDLYKAGAVEAEWPEGHSEPRFRLDKNAFNKLLYTAYASLQTPIEC